MDHPLCCGFLAAATALLLCSGSAHASEEAVDQATKYALTLDTHAAEGRSVYLSHCAACHGDSAYGNPSSKIPALAGQRYAYIVRQLANFSGSERDSAAMHHLVWQPALHDKQTWVNLAAFLSRLPANPSPQTGNGMQAALGRGIFHEQCASCHRADAGGDQDGLVPSLRGQQYPYLVDQLHKLVQGARHNVDENLVRFLRSFDERDIDGVADYLSRLQGAPASRQHMRADGSVVN